MGVWVCIPVSFEVAGKIQDLARAIDRYKQRVSQSMFISVLNYKMGTRTLLYFVVIFYEEK